MNAIEQSEPRLRHALLVEHLLYNTFEKINMLPKHILAPFKQYLMASTTSLYPIVAGPLQRISKSTSSSLMDGTHRDKQAALMLADEINSQTRSLMSHTWLWHVALGFLGYARETVSEQDPWYIAELQYEQPEHTTSAIPMVWRNLDRTQHLLIGSDWKIHDDRLLWCLCLGYLLSRTDEVREHYGSRFTRQAQIMGIEDPIILEKSLSPLAPLDRIAPKWLSILSDLLHGAG